MPFLSLITIQLKEDGLYIYEEKMILTWLWPKPMDVEGDPLENIGWGVNAETYTEWSEKAATWLAQSYSCEKISKCLVTTQPCKENHVHMDPRYKLLLKVHGCISRQERTPSQDMWRRVLSSFAKAGLLSPRDIEHAKKVASAATTSSLSTVTNEALVAWKSQGKRVALCIGYPLCLPKQPRTCQVDSH